jgi:WD40 repeat protein
MTDLSAQQPTSRRWIDHLEAPFNPCSIETIPEPIQLADGSHVWPLMMSCYQLEEEKEERFGQLNLHMIRAPDMTFATTTVQPLSFGDPHVVLHPPNTRSRHADDTASGILDGKWSRMPSRLGISETSWAFATAHSSGEIRIQALRVPTRKHSDSDGLPSHELYQVTHEAKSSGVPSVDGLDNDDPALCLSLNWDNATTSCDEVPARQNRIVSSYSNGTVAIHDVIYSNTGAAVIETDAWAAHSMLQSPAEVWSVCFAEKCFDTTTAAVISCGDEGQAKVWDIRATNRPMQVLKHHFDAGVTCVAPHPRVEHMLIMGSYDETVCIYDTRYFRPLFRSPPLGGGIWRLKWHPYTNRRLLVAAMHGGARVIDVKGFGSYVRDSTR